MNLFYLFSTFSMLLHIALADDSQYINEVLLNIPKDNDCCKMDGITCDDNGRITKIILNGKNLRTSIPESIGKLTELTELYLRENQLTGTIPDSIGNLIGLTKLNLNSNQLTGPIPESILNLKKLSDLNLYSNQLSGPIPSFDSSFVNLSLLNLKYNRLTLPFPTSLSKLYRVIIYYNRNCFLCSEGNKIKYDGYCIDNDIIYNNSLNENKCKSRCTIMQDYFRINEGEENFICEENENGQIKEL